MQRVYVVDCLQVNWLEMVTERLLCYPFHKAIDIFCQRNKPIIHRLHIRMIHTRTVALDQIIRLIDWYIRESMWWKHRALTYRRGIAAVSTGHTAPVIPRGVTAIFLHLSRRIHITLTIKTSTHRTNQACVTVSVVDTISLVSTQMRTRDRLLHRGNIVGDLARKLTHATVCACTHLHTHMFEYNC